MAFSGSRRLVLNTENFDIAHISHEAKDQLDWFSHSMRNNINILFKEIKYKTKLNEQQKRAEILRN